MQPYNIDLLDPKQYILIKGARVNNLKTFRSQYPVTSWLLSPDYLVPGNHPWLLIHSIADGQRRYVESLSAYARQFLGRMSKPEVDYIKGIAPAIAIEQKVNTRNPRSTVGTSTEIYEYLKLLFARIGKTYSPVSGNQVKRHTVSDVVDFITSFADGTRIMIFCPC
jgi:excinuclease ABC subunit A